MGGLPSWYKIVEEPVREIVYALRNAGINTECSCGHGMWIQCQCVDPTTEVDIIFNVMRGLGIKKYQVNIYAALNDTGDGEPPAGYQKVLEIMVPRSNGTYYKRWRDV